MVLYECTKRVHKKIETPKGHTKMTNNIFKYEPNEFEQQYEAELAKLVETLEVTQYEVKGDGADLQASKNVGKRKRMSAADWDDCLK